MPFVLTQEYATLLVLPTLVDMRVTVHRLCLCYCCDFMIPFLCAQLLVRALTEVYIDLRRFKLDDV